MCFFLTWKLTWTACEWKPYYLRWSAFFWHEPSWCDLLGHWKNGHFDQISNFKWPLQNGGFTQGGIKIRHKDREPSCEYLHFDGDDGDVNPEIVATCGNLRMGNCLRAKHLWYFIIFYVIFDFKQDLYLYLYLYTYIIYIYIFWTTATWATNMGPWDPGTTSPRDEPCDSGGPPFTSTQQRWGTRCSASFFLNVFFVCELGKINCKLVVVVVVVVF